jgi:WD40 repeat protein
VIFELVQDFAAALTAMPREHPKHRILALLEEAIRRDVHFIARHPTTLFQCMWNSCWWYDCPEVAKHYASRIVLIGLWDSLERFWGLLIRSEGRAYAQPPWKDSAEKMYGLLQAWHKARGQAAGNVGWLRSLRPPPISLGTGQHAVLSGHKDTVTCLAYSPDGQRIVSGSWDEAVRI